MAQAAACKFCQIAAKEIPSYIVFEDSVSLAFLDNRPLFAGHTLLIPKQHVETLADIPRTMIEPFFANVQRLAQAVEQGMDAEGSFVAINNRVSQSVPHLHVHLVPRRKKDGLRGFFWPRQSHPDEAVMQSAREAIQRALAQK
ncbi:MAG TPA: HIT family protein [Bryobacteraceae bacterium]|nr:HIT family protein [Bryobacteraceae bacterium]